MTDYVYDALNRVTNRNYSTPSGAPANYQATPNVTYTYDNLTNAKGKLTKVSSSVSTTEYTAFDILGRVTASKQTTDGVTYGNGTTDSPMTYAYNLGGALIEQQYPSGRKVRNTLDNNGDLEMISSRKNANSGYWAYANNFTYNAAGAVTAMQLGNGTWESTVFNSRLQPEHVYLGTTGNGTQAYDKLKLDYGYGTTANNGNVLSQTITVAGTGGFTAVQTYTYDSLNRIKDADEKPDGWTATNCASDPTKCWKQTFIYDRYGNRNFDEANTTTLPKSCGTSPNFTVCTADKKKFNPAVQTANNRLVLDQDNDSTPDYAFDSSGNTTKDADSRTFVYDAENKQVEVKNSSNATIGQYFYDGDGKRVKKVVPSTGETTIFVYDAGGKLVAEYSTIVANSTDAKAAYLTNDHLGSPRINTDKNGNVTARHDYHPFGEEIATSQRTAGLGYANDTVRKQFTAYERDNESELDFAQARYFSSDLGRFSSPDNFLNDTIQTDPRSWNLYIYVRNNPLRYTDPTGEKVYILTDEKDSDGNRIRLEYRDGKLFDGGGKAYTGDNAYALKALKYLNTLSGDKVLKGMITDLVNSRKEHVIQRSEEKPDFNGAKPTAIGSDIFWSGEDVRRAGADGNMGTGDSDKAIYNLAHELLGHSWRIDKGIERTGIAEVNIRLRKGKVYSYSVVEWKEIDAVNTENRARVLLGDPIRRTYGGDYIDDFLDPAPRDPNATRPTLKLSPGARKNY